MSPRYMPQQYTQVSATQTTFDFSSLMEMIVPMMGMAMMMSMLMPMIETQLHHPQTVPAKLNKQ